MNRTPILFVMGGLLLLCGCLASDASEPVVEDNQRTLLLEHRLDSLTQRNGELEEEARLKHEFLEEYVTLVNKTLTDLERITQREGMIHQARMDIEANEASGATAGSVEQRIQDNLAAINRYIEESEKQREQLESERAQLNRFARSRAVDVSSFNKTIKQLNTLIEEKEQTIRSLRDEAKTMLSRIHNLERERTVLVEENTELREAYYVVGTRIELMEKDIIDRKGGFLRIGRKTHIEQLNASNFTAGTVETAEVFVGQALKKYQILSNHRTNAALFSFQERPDGVYLTISNPEEFWKISRYLIVEVKK